jgi:hypothetical protein
MRRVILALSFGFIFVLFSERGLAESWTAEDGQIQQIAKTRSYPGGGDQEPLQVQPQLPAIGRKMKPAQEPLEAPDESPEPAAAND